MTYKLVRTIIYTSFALVLAIANNVSAQEATYKQTEFSQKQVSNDLSFLYQSLTKTHYNAFAYVSQAQYEAKYQQLRQLVDLKKRWTLLEVTSLYQQLAAIIRNGHTEIDFPAEVYIAYAQAGGTVFPFEITFDIHRALITHNYSEKGEIKAGDELLAINGKSLDEVLDSIYPLISAERHYFKQTKLEALSFPRYYWQVYGEEKTFSVTVMDQDSNEQTLVVNATPVIHGFEMQREEVLNATRKLSFYGDIAYLNPGNFSGDEIEFEEFIRNGFKQINQRRIKSLIVDLRNNAGGNDSFSNYLVSFIADKPFKWSSKFQLKTSRLLKDDTQKHRDITQPYWQQVMEHPSGSIYEYDFGLYEPQPVEQRFKGQVIVLINRQTHSQSAVTAAQIQDYGWAVIAGEETADLPSLYASQFSFQLPETGITVKVAKGKITRISGSEALKGVLPDIYLKPDITSGDDNVLSSAVSLLKEKALTEAPPN